MKMLFVPIALLFATQNARAAETVSCPLKKKNSPPVCAQKHKTKKSQTKTQSSPTVVVTPTNPKIDQAQQSAQQQDTEQESEQNQNVTVVINHPPPAPVVYRLAPSAKIVRYTLINPNRLQLMLGVSHTAYSVKSTDCCSVSLVRKHEFDIGLQYLRDIGRFTGSLMATMNSNFYIGLGFNW